MKATEHFKSVIKAYLDLRAGYDELFAVSYANPNKSLDDCVTYILNEVQKSGCAGFADEEVYSMAVHYYDEDSIEVGKPIECKVVINHTVELTEEEKAKARQDAIQRVQNEAYAKMKQSSKPSPKKIVSAPTIPSLFDF